VRADQKICAVTDRMSKVLFFLHMTRGRRNAFSSAGLVGALFFLTSATPGLAAQVLAQMDIAVPPPSLLRLSITAACGDDGAVFKLVNRGQKWPRTGMLRLYYTDDNTLIGERRLRLADNQRVSFKVKHKIMDGRPVGVWVKPDWYQRAFNLDAAMTCK